MSGENKLEETKCAIDVTEPPIRDGSCSEGLTSSTHPELFRCLAEANMQGSVTRNETNNKNAHVYGSLKEIGKLVRFIDCNNGGSKRE